VRLPTVFRYGTAPTIFTSALPLEQVVARLQRATGKLTLRLRNKPGVVGTVTSHEVRLQRLRPFDGNAFKPFFVGRFVVDAGKTELRGVFTTHWLTRLVMSLWFAVSALGALFALYVASIRGELPIVPLMGAGIFLFGVGLVALGKWLCRDEPAHLSNFIETALTKDLPSPPPVAAPAAVARHSAAGLSHNEPVDKLVAQLMSVADDSRLNELFRELDARAEEVRWFTDKDYASVALANAALEVSSSSRRDRMLGHAIYRARSHASFATSGGEGMARTNEVERIEALLRKSA
jgi:hypothetical protein